MPSNLFNNAKRAAFAMIIGAFALFAFSSCVKKVAFDSSSVVPAATGKVKIKKDKNNNYAINVAVRNLAPSGNLTPARENYIVWVDTESDGVKNIGKINTSSKLFSKSLKASLSVSMPFKPTKVFITAEDSQNPSYPGSQVVLETKTFN